MSVRVPAGKDFHSHGSVEEILMRKFQVSLKVCVVLRPVKDRGTQTCSVVGNYDYPQGRGTEASGG